MYHEIESDNILFSKSFVVHKYADGSSTNSNVETVFIPDLHAPNFNKTIIFNCECYNDSDNLGIPLTCLFVSGLFNSGLYISSVLSDGLYSFNILSINNSDIRLVINDFINNWNYDDVDPEFTNQFTKEFTLYAAGNESRMKVEHRYINKNFSPINNVKKSSCNLI